MVHIRKYHVRRQRVDQRQVALLNDALDSIAVMFGGNAGWAVGGGVSIALRSGQWYRQHHDIDIVVTNDSLTAFLERAQDRRYEVHRELWRVPLPPFLMIHRTVAGAEASSSSENIKLYLLDQENRNHFLAWLDVTVVPQEPEGTGFQMFSTPNGRTIRLAGLDLIRRMKMRRHKPCDLRDLYLIESMLGKKTPRQPSASG